MWDSVNTNQGVVFDQANVVINSRTSLSILFEIVYDRNKEPLKRESAEQELL